MSRKRNPNVKLTAELLTAVAEWRVDGNTDRQIAELVRDAEDLDCPGFHWPVCHRWRNDHDSLVEIGGQEYTPAEIMRAADGVMYEQDGLAVRRFARDLYMDPEEKYGHLDGRSKASWIRSEMWYADRRVPQHIHHSGEIDGGGTAIFLPPNEGFDGEPEDSGE